MSSHTHLTNLKLAALLGSDIGSVLFSRQHSAQVLFHWSILCLDSPSWLGPHMTFKGTASSVNAIQLRQTHTIALVLVGFLIGSK